MSNRTDTDEQEAASKHVEFQESDPESVDIMLRHLYGEGETKTLPP